MANTPPTGIKVFRYLPELDAFLPTDEFSRAAEHLGIIEWSPVVWIGRFFCLDQDFGEHWFDNWELREAAAEQAKKLGFAEEELLIIDPQRFTSSYLKDGPCHSDEHRRLFWRDVCIGLRLSVSVLIEEARLQNEARLRHLERHPEDTQARDEVVDDLEDRIIELRRQYGEA